MESAKINRCPECNRLGTKNADIKYLCRSCLSKKRCVQCGEQATKYLEKGPYHSWYCDFHYYSKVEELDEGSRYILRKGYKDENPYTKQDEPVPGVKIVKLVKEKYDLEK